MGEEVLALPADPVLVVSENELPLAVPDEASTTIEILAEDTTILVPQGD